MTNQQTGREAFEALVEKWRRQAEGNYTDRANCMSRCADELEAALAQHGREVGEPVAWQVRFLSTVHGNWSGWKDVNSEAEALQTLGEFKALGMTTEHRALYTAAPKQHDDERDAEMFKRGWDSAKEHFAPKQQAVDEAMVKRVMDAGFHRDDAIAALLAALAGKTEVKP